MALARIDPEQIKGSLLPPKAPANNLVAAQPGALTANAAHRSNLSALGGKPQPTVPVGNFSFDKAGPATPEVARDVFTLPGIGRTAAPGQAPTPIKFTSPIQSTFGAEFDPEATRVGPDEPRTGLGLNFPAPAVEETRPATRLEFPTRDATRLPFPPLEEATVGGTGTGTGGVAAPTAAPVEGGFSLNDLLEAAGPAESGFGALASLGLGTALAGESQASAGLPLRREIRAGEEARAGAESAAGLEKTQAEIELLGAQTGAATAKAVKDLSGGDTKIKFTKSRPDPFGVGADVPGSVEFAGRKHDISVEEEARLDQDIAVGLQMLQESGQGSGNPDKDLEDITRQVTRRMLMARGA